MHPAIGYDLNQAHLADLRHQAQRDALARAARAARRADRRGRPRRGGQLVLTRGAAQTPVAALVAAALAVIVYRARSARRRATGSAA